jgi:hypothetical protein
MTLPTKELIPAAIVAREFGVVRRTLARWLEDDILGFPKPEIIRTRWYFNRADLENWKPPRAKPRATADTAE